MHALTKHAQEFALPDSAFLWECALALLIKCHASLVKGRSCLGNNPMPLGLMSFYIARRFGYVPFGSALITT